jgi:biogenesis of lysosome-related organelles complex 1 subunit 1
MQDLNSGVATVFDNQKKIELEAKKLQSQVAKFSKQTSQWLQLVEEFNTALKVYHFVPEQRMNF